jgi:DNA-directed RNA polymerase specialized sigma24 family protein
MEWDEVPAESGWSERSQDSDRRPRNGRETAARAEFLDFYAEQFPKVVRFVMTARSAILADAQDAAQDAFVEAWRTVHQPGGWEQIRQREAWIRRVALRRYARPSGARRPPPTVPGAELLLSGMAQQGPGPQELAGQTLDVMTALRALEPEIRDVMAFHLDGFACGVIADQFGIDEQRVRNLLKKARINLVRELTRVPEQEGGMAR